MPSDAPERLYLEPPGPSADDRTWCQHNVYDPDEYGGVAATEYIRADIAYMQTVEATNDEAQKRGMALSAAVKIMERHMRLVEASAALSVNDTAMEADAIDRQVRAFLAAIKGESSNAR
jgi:hypothetical protein